MYLLNKIVIFLNILHIRIKRKKSITVLTPIYFFNTLKENNLKRRDKMIILNDYLKNVPVLSKTNAHIWLLELDKSSYTLNSILSEDEKIRANQFINQKSKQTFIACRGILRTLLGIYLKIDPQEIKLEYNSYGKPYVSSLQNYQDINFSLSHSQDIAAFSFSQYQTIGIDIENINSDFNPNELSPHIMTNTELKNFHKLSQSEKVHAFYHLWTQKEAIVKAKGTGFQKAPNKISGYLTPDINLNNFHIEDWRLNSFIVKNNYSTCICTKNNIFFHPIQLPTIASLYSAPQK
ncbi:4'-phosphopantetheinyl transferase superfamily protein [Bacillus thuringiensis]|nr:4'-phosphopantetheinyl transferase superfamily protein [Bacillus thuringiensis]OTX73113.1 hypothetical protein BK722_11330 [Bacillus thuringiensis serovar finitimus]